MATKRVIPFYVSKPLYEKMLNEKHQERSGRLTSIGAVIRESFRLYGGGPKPLNDDGTRKRVAVPFEHDEMQRLQEIARTLSLKESRNISFGEVLRRAVASYFS